MLKEFLSNSYLFGGNAPFIEELYEKYLVNPQSVPEEWRDYFDRMQDLPGAIASLNRRSLCSPSSFSTSWQVSRISFARGS